MPHYYFFVFLHHESVNEKMNNDRNNKIGNALMAIMALVGGLCATITFAVIIYKILI